MIKYSKTIFILCLAILFTACSTKETIKIGFVGTLTGANSEIGIAMRDGLLLKVDEINNEGGINGRQIEIIIRDDKNQLDNIVAIDKEFVDKGIKIIFGHELSSKAKPMLEATAGKEVILISPTLSTYEMSGIDDNFFRTITSNYDQGAILGEYAKVENNKTLIVFDNNNAKFAEGVYEGYLDTFGGNYDFYPIKEQLVDVAENIANRYENEKFDSLLFVMNPNDVMYLSQIFYKNKLDVNIFSSNWGMATNALKDGGKAIEGAVFTSLMGNLDRENYINYRELYLKKYNKEPEFASIYSYEAAILMFNALKSSGKIEYKEIKKSLLSLKNQDGVISEFELNEYGDVSRESFIVIVENGELVILDK